MSTLDLLPHCDLPACGVQLVLRGGYDPKTRGNGHTREQRECGIWYDHPPTADGLAGHTTTALLPTPGGPADHPAPERTQP